VNDAIGLKKIIETLWNGPSLAVMGKKGRKLVEQKYQPQKHLEQILNIYNNLKDEKNSAGN